MILASAVSRARGNHLRQRDHEIDGPAQEIHDQGPATWTPRRLPEPLVSVAGSRAQQAMAEASAQEERRKAARLEELRVRAAEMAPAEPVRLPAASSSPYAKMGFVDDAEIEEHVRQLLARRAAG